MKLGQTNILKMHEQQHTNIITQNVLFSKIRETLRINRKIGHASKQIINRRKSEHKQKTQTNKQHKQIQ